MIQGYWTKQINELEKKKDALERQLVPLNLSLKAIDKQINSSYKAMNSETYRKKSNPEMLELEYQIVDLKRTIESDNVTIKELQQIIKERNTQNSNLQDMIIELKNSFENKTDANNEKLRGIKKEFASIRKECAELKKENKKLKNQRSLKDKQIKSLQKSKEDLIEQIQFSKTGSINCNEIIRQKLPANH